MGGKKSEKDEEMEEGEQDTYDKIGMKRENIYASVHPCSGLTLP